MFPMVVCTDVKEVVLEASELVPASVEDTSAELVSASKVVPASVLVTTVEDSSGKGIVVELVCAIVLVCAISELEVGSVERVVDT